MLRDYWISPVINRPFVLEMGKPHFLQQKSKKLAQCFQIEKHLDKFYVWIFNKDWIFYSYFACQLWGNILRKTIKEY